MEIAAYWMLCLVAIIALVVTPIVMHLEKKRDEEGGD